MHRVGPVRAAEDPVRGDDRDEHRRSQQQRLDAPEVLGADEEARVVGEARHGQAAGQGHQPGLGVLDRRPPEPPRGHRHQHGHRGEEDRHAEPQQVAEAAAAGHDRPDREQAHSRGAQRHECPADDASGRRADAGRDEHAADRQQRRCIQLVERLRDSRRHPGRRVRVHAGHDVDQLGKPLVGAEPGRVAVEEDADVALLEPAHGAVDPRLRVDLLDEAQAVQPDDAVHPLGIGLDAELLDELDQEQREAVVVEPLGQGDVLRRGGDERRGDAGEHDAIDPVRRVHPIELAAQEVRAGHLGDAGDDREPAVLQLLDALVVVPDRHRRELDRAADEVEVVARDRHRLDVERRAGGADALEDPRVALRQREVRAVAGRDRRPGHPRRAGAPAARMA